MQRMLTALSASAVLLGTMLAPSARALVPSGHAPLRVTRKLPHAGPATTIKVVYLGASFSPSTVTLTAGEPLIVIVRRNVRASLQMTAGKSLVYGGQGGGIYLFYGRRAGMATVAAAVRPRCAANAKVCLQWRTAPGLVVTTS